MPWPTLDQPLDVTFADRPSDDVRREFPNRLSMGDALPRNVVSLITMTMLREAVDRDHFVQQAHRSGTAKPPPPPPAPVNPVVPSAQTPGVTPAPEGRQAGGIVMSTMRRMVDGILTGASLEKERPAIHRFISNQEERAQVFSNLRLTLEFERITRMLELRETLELRVHEAAQRGDLNPSEMLALLTKLDGDIDGATKLVRGRAQTPDDVTALLEKVDSRLQEEHEELARSHYAQRTPYGREIARRLLHKLQKITADKKSA